MTQLTMFVPPIWKRSVSHHSRRNERPRTRCSVRFPTQPSKRAERPSPRSSSSRLHLITVDVNGIVRKARIRPVRLTDRNPREQADSAGEHGLREARRTTQLAMFVPPICRRRR